MVGIVQRLDAQLTLLGTITSSFKFHSIYYVHYELSIALGPPSKSGEGVFGINDIIFYLSVSTV